MPPKKGAKKGKKGGDDDDAYWEQKAAELELKNQELAAADEPTGGAKGHGAFDMLDDEDEDGGGLMVSRWMVSGPSIANDRAPSSRRARKRTRSPRRSARMTARTRVMTSMKHQRSTRQ